MIINVKVKPNSGKKEIKKLAEDSYEASVKEPAEKDKANKELLKMLADFFSVHSSKIKIISGLKSRKKILRIEK